MRKRTTATVPDFVPYQDQQRHTCIQIERVFDSVKFIPLDSSTGLEVHALAALDFDERYRAMSKFPLDKACQIYLNYSQTIGATAEALNYLAKVIKISAQEFETALAKKPIIQNIVEETPAIPRVTTRAKKRAATPPEISTPAAIPASLEQIVLPDPPPPSIHRPRRSPAAQLVQDLIVQGDFSDDQIFEIIKNKFGLDDARRGDIRLFRNLLQEQQTS